MKTVVPDYYCEFQCIAGACRHTCCEGWEIDIDEETLARWRDDEGIMRFVEQGDPPRIRTGADERCPFLRADGLCDMIITRGEAALCQICRDHPRFRNYFSDRVELGLGLVCEEAARLILGRTEPVRFVTLSDDGGDEQLTEDEQWLLELRDGLLANITETGPRARLLEYLICRHLPDALYDGRVEERLAFIERSFAEVTALWERTDGSLESLAECARAWSYDVEYDDEELERRIAGDR